ncbi:MAG: NADH-ubiquinone oxidoreductase-F iron-sulfur binding region domain-containing protein [Christensenellaceae bacterium]
MSRLSIITQNKAQATVEELYKDVERRISASPSGLCPVDMASSFLKMCHAQSCGKCVPCRIGLGQLEKLLDDVLDGNATLDTIDLIEKTAESIYFSADCAIGYEAANMVLKGIRGFRDDFVEHIEHGRSNARSTSPSPWRSVRGRGYPRYISSSKRAETPTPSGLSARTTPCGHLQRAPCQVAPPQYDGRFINIRGLKRLPWSTRAACQYPSPCPHGQKVASSAAARYFRGVLSR